MLITKKHIYFCIIIMLILIKSALAQQTDEASIDSNGFRAAVVKVDITPQNPQWLEGYHARKSTGVNRHIYLRIIALNDGTSSFYLVSSELCLISPSEYDRVANLLKEKYDIDPSNFWWSTTHTHSAPEIGPAGLPGVFMPERYQHDHNPEYTTLVEKKLIKGINKTRHKLESAQLGVGWGFSRANINRRGVGTDGKVFGSKNPDAAVDRRIGLLRISHKDGRPLAVIANYPIHSTVLGPSNTKIDGDVAGIVSGYVEKKIGAPLVFINGAAGNLAPIYSYPPHSLGEYLPQFKVLLGDKILEANRRISYTTDKITLNTGSLTVKTPRKSGLGWPTDIKNYSYATKRGKKIIKLPVKFLKINKQIAIWSAPLELFCQISNEIREHSPFPYTFYYGYTNGWLGYMPTKAAWNKGGYEVNRVSPYTPSAPIQLKEAVMGYLEAEMQGF